MTEPLNYTRASGGAFQGWLHSSAPSTAFERALLDGLCELANRQPYPALDGGSRVWKHHWEWTEVEWKRGGQAR